MSDDGLLLVFKCLPANCLHIAPMCSANGLQGYRLQCRQMLPWLKLPSGLAAQHLQLGLQLPPLTALLLPLLLLSHVAPVLLVTNLVPQQQRVPDLLQVQPLLLTVPQTEVLRDRWRHRCRMQHPTAATPGRASAQRHTDLLYQHSSILPVTHTHAM
jgi:hypothetical protein